jgi:hypothetical protein
MENGGSGKSMPFFCSPEKPRETNGFHPGTENAASQRSKEHSDSHGFSMHKKVNLFFLMKQEEQSPYWLYISIKSSNKIQGKKKNVPLYSRC